MKCPERSAKNLLYVLPILAAWAVVTMQQTRADISAQKDKAPDLSHSVTAIKNFHSGVLVFSADSKMLANGVAGKIQIWDTRTWKLLRTLRNPAIKPPFCFSPNGTTITLSLTDDRMQVWNVRTAKPLRTLPGFRTHVNFSPDGSLMAGWNVNQGEPLKDTIQIWNTRTGSREHSLENLTTPSDQYVFSRDNKRLIVASVDNFIKIYDVNSGKIINDEDALDDIRPPIVLSPDGSVFTTLMTNGLVGDDPAPGTDVRPFTDSGLASAYSAQLWNARTGKLIRSFGYWETKIEPTAPLGFTSGSKNFIYNVGDKQAYGSGTHAMIFDVKTGEALETFDIANPAVLSPDGKILVGGDETLQVWAIPH